ncbi:MAG TPA: hypothetical protein VGB45_12175 [Abditibacterium sp.]|jgi:hypothetical protein
MALGFGRKKATPEAQTGAPDVNSAPAVAPGRSSDADSDSGEFDLDAFAAQLETSQNTTTSGAAPAAGGSAFDFPDLETTRPESTKSFDLDTMFADDAPQAAPQRATPLSAAPEPTVESLIEPESLDLDAMFEAESRQALAAGKIPPPAPFVPPSVALNAPEPTTPFYEEQIPAAKAKKKLPMVPIVGALAVLGLVGGAASYMMSEGTPEEVVAPAAASRPNRPVAAEPATSLPKPAAPAKPGAVSPGIAPASSQLAQMKALWKRGAAAKQRGDFAGARRYWQQGLKIQPNNIGFQESIAKLPK